MLPIGIQDVINLVGIGRMLYKHASEHDDAPDEDVRDGVEVLSNAVEIKTDCCASSS